VNTSEPSAGGASRAAGGPYVGPRPFRSSEADLFFGRSNEARDVRALWLTQPLTVLHGQAGAGKTSLLNAGIVPLLGDEDGADLLPVGRLVHQSARPVAADSAGKGYRYTLLSSWAPFAEPAEAGTTIQEFLAARSRSKTPGGPPSRMLAAIDHFEELFTAFPASDTQREQLIDELGEALRQVDFHLLLIVRDDHLATLNRYMARLSPHAPAHQEIRALNVKAAMEAVTGPLARTARRFGPGVAEALIERLRTFSYTNRLNRSVTLKNDWIEPLDLQMACTSLWSALPDDVDIITDENLQAFGDPDQAAGKFYNDAVSKISRWSQPAVSEAQLRDWIESTFVTERGTRGIALRGITMTGDMPNSIADAFANSWILTAEYRNQSTWYQLAQDRLIEAVRNANKAVRFRDRDIFPAESATAAGLRAEAEAAFGIGNFARAHDLITVALERHRAAKDSRGLAHTFELQGEVARVQGDLNAAERSFRSALFEFSSLGDTGAQARLLSTLGDIFDAVGDYQEAVTYHRRASDRLPASVDALTGLGYALWHKGSPADAEATFSKALDWNRNKGEALAGRGQVRVELRAYLGALADLDRAIDLGLPLSNEIDARSARAVALANMGQHADADRELRAAQSSDPGRALTRLRAGRVAAFLGQNARARDELEHALRAQPPLPPKDEKVARDLLKELGQKTGS
jgi:tetratricopeptide (TPR) repeat protein